MIGHVVNTKEQIKAKNLKYGEANRKNVAYKSICLPKWNREHAKSPTPRNLTVTNVSQDLLLKSVDDVVAIDESIQTTGEWISSKEIDQTTIDQLVKSAAPNRNSILNDIKPNKHEVVVRIEEANLINFESQIISHLDQLNKRIEWLNSDSRKMFGVIQGEKPCILIDTSHENCSYERLHQLKEDIKFLYEDQLIHKQKLMLCSFGTNFDTLWDKPKPVSNASANDVTEWINSLQPSGSTNLLSALKQIATAKDIDSIVIIMGTDPDQHVDTIISYLEEVLSGRHINLLLVAFHNKFPSTKIFLEELAHKMNGRFHTMSISNTIHQREGDIIISTDMIQLYKEIKRLENVFKEVKDLRNGCCINNIRLHVNQSKPLSSAIVKYVTKANQVNTSLADELSTLCIEQPSKRYQTYQSSKDWLKTYCLTAKGLSLYQVMAPNAYSYVNSYVTVLNKNVLSKTHHESMAQMEWKDGSIKNVHIDPVLLQNYQHHLKTALKLYKKRLVWLNNKSKKSMGVFTEDNIILVVDMCNESSEYLHEIQQEIKQVFEQQLINKKYFNMLCTGNNVRSFSTKMVELTEVAISACWRWFLCQRCEGERNILPSLKFCLENEEERKQNISVDGIYLLISGRPSKPQDLVCGYMEEALVGENIALNCIYFQPVSSKTYDTDETVAGLKYLATLCNGRFHWTNSLVSVDSDDIRLINEEMAKANNFLNKTGLLLEKIMSRKIEKKEIKKLSICDSSSHLVKNAITYPKQTALSKARISLARPKSAQVVLSKKAAVRERPHTAKENKSNLTTTWKPFSQQGALKQQAPPQLCSKTSKSFTDRKVVAEERPLHQTFYTEIGNNIGSMLGVSSTASKIKRPLSACKVSIPNSEESITTKTWLSRYSLSKMRLDVNRISTKCGHTSSNVASIGKSVSARYCEIFPSIQIDGVTKHLLLNVKELQTYEENIENVLRRYLKRLKWLLQGSRRVFGTLTEDQVILLIDTSGSMVTYIDQLKEDLITLLWEQIYHGKKMFNFIRYSKDVECFSPVVVEASKANCNRAVEWINNLQCYGETATLNALRMAFECRRDHFGIYLLTDGKPDNSTTMVLRETVSMNVNRAIKIHTISFQCNDSTANTLLQMLALQTKGRYHEYADSKEDVTTLLDGTLQKPEAKAGSFHESDDIKRLLKEINLARKYLLIVNEFKSVLSKD